MKLPPSDMPHQHRVESIRLIWSNLPTIIYIPGSACIHLGSISLSYITEVFSCRTFSFHAHTDEWTVSKQFQSALSLQEIQSWGWEVGVIT